MEIQYAEEFFQQYKKLPENIKKKAIRQEAIFRDHPFYPSLHTEKLIPKTKDIWSFRIDRTYRILFRFEDKNLITFLSVGHHAWIYSYMK
jgi:toxin HigB-1